MPQDCLKVDDELKLDRLLHWKISGPGAFQNLVHIRSGAPVMFTLNDLLQKL
jgi:hypothetical protein